MSAPVLEARGIGKKYAGVVALEGVDFNVQLGKIHALVGENGAGKSTLSKILTGFEAHDTGEILVDGAVVSLGSPSAAIGHGISIVHQELSVIGSLSVAENVLVGMEPAAAGWIDRKALAAQSQVHLERVGLDVDPRTSAGSLSVAQQQLVEIARALAMNSRVIFFDEPTSSLPRVEARRLIALLQELRADGHAVVLISHDLDEVLEIADVITVLRDGRLMASNRASEMDESAMIRLMIGRDLEETDAERSPHDISGPPILAAEGLAGHGVLEADIAVRPGEVLGIGGLVGSGRSELLELIFGMREVRQGTISLDGGSFRPSSPAAALAVGVGLVPESRRDQGLNLGLSIAHNVELASLGRLGRGWWLGRKAGRTLVEEYRERLHIKCASVDMAVSGLSGGNQQKVVLAKILATRPRVLLLDEPTRGIDVGAKAEIHRLIRALADEGLAVVMVSSVLPELLAVSDRIVVMRGGRTVGTLEGAEMTEESVTRLAFQG